MNSFHNHLDKCLQCRENPFELCNNGVRALLETIGSPEHFDRPLFLFMNPMIGDYVITDNDREPQGAEIKQVLAFSYVHPNYLNAFVAISKDTQTASIILNGFPTVNIKGDSKWLQLISPQK